MAAKLVLEKARAPDTATPSYGATKPDAVTASPIIHCRETVLVTEERRRGRTICHCVKSSAASGGRWRVESGDCPATVRIPTHDINPDRASLPRWVARRERSWRQWRCPRGCCRRSAFEEGIGENHGLLRGRAGE